MILNLGGGRQTGSSTAQAAVIKDGDTRSFNDDVIRASMTTPVIVDFWAPWCQPCKQLTPTIERVVQQANGRVRLVKINIDENQDLAAQLRIQSVPTVYAFIGGRPVDAFVGAQPESKIRQFVDLLLQGAASPLDDLLAQAQAALDAGDARAAADGFARVLKEDPRQPKAIAGLIRARVAQGDPGAARKLATGLPQDLAAAPEIKAALTAIDVAEEAKRAAGDLADLERKVAADPADLQAKFDLALALYGRGRSEAAIDQLLELIRRDNHWNDEAARKQLVKIFDALGPTHPLTAVSRRKLSSLLFS
ncbi:MAG: thioredoxin [Rhodospirillales bacterium]